jgi:nucleotide-binding universal stress UspA family protein
MSDQNTSPVVVAVGHDEGDAALEYAAAESARLACGLHLVQFVRVVPQDPAGVLVDVADVGRVGRHSLEAALGRACALIGDEATLTGELVLGGVVPALVRAARDARLVVLQHRSLTGMRRVVTRPLTSGVAAHAPVPVVSVPELWSADRDADMSPVVTVGLDGGPRAEEVLHAAAGAARARGATLLVLHALTFANAHRDLVMTRLDDEPWTSWAPAEIQAVLDRLGDAVTGVPVRIVTRRMKPADALIQASQRCQLVVIGRPDPTTRVGSHLGPVARAVLAEAACPVLLANPRSGEPLRRPQRVSATAP